MTEQYRVKGVTGSDNITVFTEWMDEPKGVVEGVAVGLQIKGWQAAEVQSRSEVEE